MTVDEVVSSLQEALWAVALLGLPALAASLLVGLLISLFQALTSVQEATLTFAPKLFVVLVVVGLGSPQMFSLLDTLWTGLLDTAVQVPADVGEGPRPDTGAPDTGGAGFRTPPSGRPGPL